MRSSSPSRRAPRAAGRAGPALPRAERRPRRRTSCGWPACWLGPRPRPPRRAGPQQPGEPPGAGGWSRRRRPLRAGRPPWRGAPGGRLAGARSRRVAQQGVAEAVLPRGSATAVLGLEDGVVDELVEVGLELGQRAAHDRGQEPIVEGAADHRGHLGQVAGRAEPVEATGHHLEDRRRQGRVLVLQGGPGQLLEEQRDALGPVQDVRARGSVEWPVAGDEVDQFGRDAAVEAADGHHVGFGSARSASVGVRTRRHEEQHGVRLRGDGGDGLQRRRIGPLDVFQHQQQRAARRQRPSSSAISSTDASALPVASSSGNRAE